MIANERLSSTTHRFRFHFENVDSPPLAAADTWEKLRSILNDLAHQFDSFKVVVEVIVLQTAFNERIERLKQSLSRREQEVFDLAMQGTTSKEIAQRLSISMDTVKSHRRSIVGKAGTKSVAEILNWQADC